MCFGCVSLLATKTLADGDVIPQSSSLYDELITVATKWKNAVLNKDIKVFVDLALPEYKEPVASKLRDHSSNIYQLFFGGKKSFYQILRKAKKLKIVLIKYEGLEEHGEGVSAYYYDSDRLKLKFPLGSERGQELYNRGDIIHIFFFKSEDQWFASFEFFE